MGSRQYVQRADKRYANVVGDGTLRLLMLRFRGA